ncbi:hypothetical protein [Bacteroides coprosuis]|uniref:hypothetical protein n=1 Tax=Bacteroides coprosuis TaxID=151276 RepID=UPI001D703A2F|nr:hypothetical protein [Bacteroides coprosuis]HJD91359.1 hypothetical protein [Bacteroides coprosuis]
MRYYIGVGATLLSALLVTSCGSGESTHLQAYHSGDSLLTIEARTGLQEREYPSHIVLYTHENEDTDFRFITVTPEKYINQKSFVTQADDQIDRDYSDKKSYITKVSQNDSIIHYQFSKGLLAVQEWYMLKQGKKSDYIIYYKGVGVKEAEAMRLYNSLKENEHEEAYYVMGEEDYKEYVQSNFAIRSDYKLMQDKTFISMTNRMDTKNKLQAAYVMMLSDKPIEILNITVFRADEDEAAFTENYLKSLKESGITCQSTQFQGRNAIEFETLQIEAPEPQNNVYVKGLNFMYKGSWYQISITGVKDSIDTEFTKVIDAVRLI